MCPLVSCTSAPVLKRCNAMIACSSGSIGDFVTIWTLQLKILTRETFSSVANVVRRAPVLDYSGDRRSSAGRSRQSPRQLHDALPLAPAELDSSRIRSKQFDGTTPLHGCRILKPVALFSLRVAAPIKSPSVISRPQQPKILGCEPGLSRSAY